MQKEMLLFPIKLHQTYYDQRKNLRREVEVVKVWESAQYVGTENHICNSDHKPLPESNNSTSHGFAMKLESLTQNSVCPSVFAFFWFVQNYLLIHCVLLVDAIWKLSGQGTCPPQQPL